MVYPILFFSFLLFWFCFTDFAVQVDNYLLWVLILSLDSSNSSYVFHHIVWYIRLTVTYLETRFDLPSRVLFLSPVNCQTFWMLFLGILPVHFCLTQISK